MEGGLSAELMQVFSHVDRAVYDQLVGILRECLQNSNKLLEIEQKIKESV